MGMEMEMETTLEYLDPDTILRASSPTNSTLFTFLECPLKVFNNAFGITKE